LTTDGLTARVSKGSTELKHFKLMFRLLPHSFVAGERPRIVDTAPKRPAGDIPSVCYYAAPGAPRGAAPAAKSKSRSKSRSKPRAGGPSSSKKVRREPLVDLNPAGAQRLLGAKQKRGAGGNQHVRTRRARGAAVGDVDAERDAGRPPY